MDPTTDIEIVKLVVEATVQIGVMLYNAFKTGDMSALQRPVHEILPETLRVTLAKRAADAEAKAKFGTPPPSSV